MIKKAFTGVTTFLLLAGVALAQEKTKSKPVVKKDCTAATCTTAKGKSCCQQPSKTANLRLAAVNKTKAKAQ
ncbi:hypothetical protein FHW36_101707 [Chitinophaga polysaccharea]|uniref:Uncharacterized protein n=1 Tax=Chitinophaga polysaccharea TaxID=1293035 RepID=A0A561Q390_9BACT|nr:hypothetical protein [Chitinophaga polysaccharea]TWF44786.1 hypothetical protein FHW36_101707 [Chitinophaga polysaccharea]